MKTSELTQRIITIVTHELFTSFLSLIALALLIWFVGPMIMIVDKIPLESITNRLLLTVLIGFIWCVNKFAKTSPSPVTNLPQRMDNALEISGELALLQNNFKIALNFLKTSGWKKTNRKFTTNLPWYLLIGPSAAGKTTLLNHAEIKFIQPDFFSQQASEALTATNHCGWWFSENAVILDVPGKYIYHKEANKTYQQIWHGFIKLFKCYLIPKSIRGIVVTLSLHELITQSKQNQDLHLRHVKLRIQELVQELGTVLPIYILITKFDTLSGFTECFTELSGNDRRQVWGITFNNAHAQHLSQNFIQQYETLLKRLHSQLIWRLQHEREIHKRESIIEFPLQMESLKGLLTNVIYQLADVAAYRDKAQIQGIYFCSSVQNNYSIDRLFQPLSSSFAIQPRTTKTISSGNKAYFITEFFKELVLKSHNITELPLHPMIMWARRAVYVIAVMLIVMSTSFWSNIFSQRMETINAVHDAVTEYKILMRGLASQGDYSVQTLNFSLAETLASLNALQKAMDLLDHSNQAWVLHFTLHQENMLKNTIKKAYRQALSTTLMPLTKVLLEQQLTKNTDAKSLYNTLQIYLMLNDPNHFKPDLIKSWLVSYAEQNLPAHTAQQLRLHINNVKTLSPTTFTLNQHLIDTTRTNLNNLPYRMLAYLILQNQNTSVTDNFLASLSSLSQVPDKTFAYNSKDSSIPSLYTAAEFSEIYFNRINVICQNILQGDWVLGMKNGAHLTDKELNQLTHEVRNLYVNDYANWWKDFSANITLLPAKTMKQAIKQLQILTSATSPLIRIIHEIADNTELSQLIPTTTAAVKPQETAFIEHAISNKFIEFHRLLQNPGNNQASRLTKILLALSELKDKLIVANNSNKAAFNAVKTHAEISTNDALTALQNQATFNEEPLKSWVITIKQHAWQLMLDSAQNYLTSIWQFNVVPEYNNTIKNRYPLDKKASLDISLSDFAHFFAPNGTLDNYFALYIMPFIDIHQIPWQWKNMDGISFNLPGEFLQQFEQAATIQRIFFSLGNQQLSLRFSLQPLSVEPIVKKVTLNLNGQLIETQPGAIHVSYLAWPGSGRSDTVSLAFEDIDGQTVALKESGPWAWFRLLDKAHIRTITKPTQFEVALNLDGNGVKYLLTATNAINPFAPGTLQQFRLVEQLNIPPITK